MAFVRRRSAAFSRGRSAFRGVSGQAGRWEARIGGFGGKKNVSLRLLCSSLGSRLFKSWQAEAQHPCIQFASA